MENAGKGKAEKACRQGGKVQHGGRSWQPARISAEGPAGPGAGSAGEGEGSGETDGSRRPL